MLKPQVFISSTYYDLRHVRARLEDFIKDYGFDPVLFERGSIAYLPQLALEESAYRAVRKAQILVLIVGGSPGTPSQRPRTDTAPETPSSITWEEFRTAVQAGMLTYTFVESVVATAHETYVLNRDSTVKYAHVESTDVFKFIDFIRAQNCFLFSFNDPKEIMAVLRTQWADIFYEYLTQARDLRRIKTIETMMGDLNDAVGRLESYTERIMRGGVGQDRAEMAITEQRRASGKRKLERLFGDFQASPMGRFIGRFQEFGSPAQWASAVLEAPDIREFMRQSRVPEWDAEYVTSHDTAEELYSKLRAQVEPVVANIESRRMPDR